MLGNSLTSIESIRVFVTNTNCKRFIIVNYAICTLKIRHYCFMFMIVFFCIGINCGIGGNRLWLNQGDNVRAHVPAYMPINVPAYGLQIH